MRSRRSDAAFDPAASGGRGPPERLNRFAWHPDWTDLKTRRTASWRDAKLPTSKR